MQQLTVDPLADKTVYPYIIAFRNEAARYVNIIGFLLTFGSAVLFLREMIIRQQVVVPYIAGIIFIILLVAWSWYIARKKDISVQKISELLRHSSIAITQAYFGKGFDDDVLDDALKNVF